MPPSISATLAARVDRLDAGARRLLATASVIGEVFTWERLRQLLPPGEQDASSTGLLRLARLGEIIPTRAGVDDAFRFRHALLRDVVYEGIAKRERAALHERMARILEEAPDQVAVDAEAAGTHFELAATYARAIGEPTERSDALASRAARQLYRAGRRAAGSGDHERALRLLNRALDLVPSPGIQRAEILWALLGPTTSAGLLGRREWLVDELKTMTSSGGQDFTVIANVTAVSEAIEQLYYAPHDAELERARRTVKSAADSLRTAGDGAAHAYALQMLGEVEWTAGKVNLALEACEEGLAAAANEGGWAIASTARTIVTLLEYGPTPILDGIVRARELLAQVEHGLWTAAYIHAELALLCAWADDTVLSTKMLEQALALSTDITDPDMRHELFWATGHADHLLGDSGKGLEQLRAAWDHWKARGHIGNVALLSWDYGRLLSAVNDYVGLEDVGRVVRETAGRFDAYGQAAWRGILSSVALARDDLVTADDFSRQACSLADETDFLNLRGDLWADRAIVQLNAGDPVASAEATAQAQLLYQAKQNARALRELRA
jgi:tetratricopeptide (TPR) repeat protein